MDKRLRAVLVGIGVVLALWVVAHIPRYSEYRSRCAWGYPSCEHLLGLCTPDNNSCERERQKCKSCQAESWRAFLP
jgi:hypothetical protein